MWKYMDFLSGRNPGKTGGVYKLIGRTLWLKNEGRTREKKDVWNVHKSVPQIFVVRRVSLQNIT